MSKNAFFTGQPVFSQLINLIPRHFVESLSAKHNANRYYKSFMAFDHLVTMLYSGFMSCSSLRELEIGLQASVNRLRHLGLKKTPRRSTIADANAKRTERFFGDLFHMLREHYFPILSDSRSLKKIDEKLFAVDSTTITLFSNIMKGAGTYDKNGKRKGGAKAHILMKVNEAIPVFVDITESKENDQVIMDKLLLPKGSFITFDKAYRKTTVLKSWNEEGITWVTRPTSHSYMELIKERKLKKREYNRGVRSDNLMLMGRGTNKNSHILKVRCIEFYDYEKECTLFFITNNIKLRPSTIASIYKKRWSIELLFKRLKTHNPLQYFLGDNENAVKIQIWCALINDLLVSLIQRNLMKRGKKWSFANLAGLIRQHLFTYIHLIKFLTNPQLALLQFNSVQHQNDDQMSLFDTDTS